jgi:hypothetical protein
MAMNNLATSAHRDTMKPQFYTFERTTSYKHKNRKKCKISGNSFKIYISEDSNNVNANIHGTANAKTLFTCHLISLTSQTVASFLYFLSSWSA